jgi:hypothetical protein
MQPPACPCARRRMQPCRYRVSLTVSESAADLPRWPFFFSFLAFRYLQDRAGQGRAGQGEAQQHRAGHSSTGQDRPRHSRQSRIG